MNEEPFDGHLDLSNLRLITRDVIGVELSSREAANLYDALDTGRGVELSQFLALFVDGDVDDRDASFVRKERMQIAAENTVTAIKLSPCGTLLACGGMDGIARVINVTTGREIFQKKLPAQISAITLAIAPSAATQGAGNRRGTTANPPKCERLGVGCFAPGVVEWIDTTDKRSAAQKLFNAFRSSPTPPNVGLHKAPLAPAFAESVDSSESRKDDGSNGEHAKGSTGTTESTDNGSDGCESDDDDDDSDEIANSGPLVQDHDEDHDADPMARKPPAAAWIVAQALASMADESTANGKLLFSWSHGADVNAMEACSHGEELAVAGADRKATIYCLRTGTPRYVFSAGACLWSVALAQRRVYDVLLDDGTLLLNIDEQKVEAVRENAKVSPIEAAMQRSSSAPANLDASASSNAHTSKQSDKPNSASSSVFAACPSGTRVWTTFSGEVSRVRNERSARRELERQRDQQRSMSLSASSRSLSAKQRKYQKSSTTAIAAADGDEKSSELYDDNPCHATADFESDGATERRGSSRMRAAFSMLRFDVVTLPDGASFDGGTEHEDLAQSSLTPLHHKRLLDVLARHEQALTTKRVSEARLLRRRQMRSSRRSSAGADLWAHLQTKVESRIAAVHMKPEQLEPPPEQSEASDHAPLRRSSTSPQRPSAPLAQGVQYLADNLHVEHQRDLLARLASEVEGALPRLTVGDHVECLLSGTVLESRHAKVVAFGGEQQRVVAWRYDLTAPPRHLHSTHSGGADERTNNEHLRPGFASALGRMGASSRSLLARGHATEGVLSNNSTYVREMSSNGGAGRHWAAVQWESNLGHTVFAVALSSGGRRCAVGGAGPVVSVFDLDEEGALAFSQPVADTVFGVSLSQAGDQLAIAGASKEVTIFDVITGAQLFHAPAADRLRAVDLSKNAEQIAFGGFDRRITTRTVRSGATLHSIELEDVVRSVSLDRFGRHLAIGTEDSKCLCYDVDGASGSSILLRWVAHHKAKVWVVAMSADGAYVAAGDYADTVRVYDRTTGNNLWEKTTWAGSGAPFTWGLAWSADARTLVIGHWDSHAYVIGCDTAGSHWGERCAPLRRDDRVYAVDVDARGRRVAVGGRDKLATVYELEAFRDLHGRGSRPSGGIMDGAGQFSRRSRASANEESDEDDSDVQSEVSNQGAENHASGTKMIGLVARLGRHARALPHAGAPCRARRLCSISRPAFIYALALTADGTMLAVGGVDKIVLVCDVERKLEPLHRLSLDGVVQSLEFSPNGRHLATGCEDKLATIWRLPLLHAKNDRTSGTESSSNTGSGTASTEGGASEIVADKPIAELILPRAAAVASVSLSDVSFAVAAGSLATIYGRGHNRCAWTDRPAFDVVADMLDHKGALEATLRSFPDVVNSVNPHNGESLLALAVRKKPVHVLGALLNVPCALGLLPDLKGHTAVTAALRRDAKPAMRALLHTCATSRMSTQPLALRPVMRHRAELAARYPDLFLEFISTLRLTSESSLVQSNNTVLLPVPSNARNRGDDTGKPATNGHGAIAGVEASNEDFVVRGSMAQQPVDLWHDLLADAEAPTKRVSRSNARNPTRVGLGGLKQRPTRGHGAKESGVGLPGLTPLGQDSSMFWTKLTTASRETHDDPSSDNLNAKERPLWRRLTARHVTSAPHSKAGRFVRPRLKRDWSSLRVISRWWLHEEIGDQGSERFACLRIGPTVVTLPSSQARTKKVDVTAWRIPLPAIVGESVFRGIANRHGCGSGKRTKNSGHEEEHHGNIGYLGEGGGGQSLLRLIANAALDQGDFRVYSSLVLRATLDFKWQR